MIQLVLASKPQVEITLRAYETLSASLQITRSVTHDIIAIEQIDKELQKLEPLINQAAVVLKNLEG